MRRKALDERFEEARDHGLEGGVVAWRRVADVDQQLETRRQERRKRASHLLVRGAGVRNGCERLAAARVANETARLVEDYRHVSVGEENAGQEGPLEPDSTTSQGNGERRARAGAGRDSR
jgi:hypothetical protein